MPTKKHIMQMKFTSEEWDSLLDFQSRVNYNPNQEQISLTELCKKSIYMTIQRAYATAQKMASEAEAAANGTSQLITEEVSDVESTSGEPAGDHVETSLSQDTDSNVLAEKTDAEPANV